MGKRVTGESRPPKTYQAGRRCACGTKLSIYNRDEVCAPCSRNTFAHKTAPTIRSDIPTKTFSHDVTSPGRSGRKGIPKAPAQVRPPEPAVEILRPQFPEPTTEGDELVCPDCNLPSPSLLIFTIHYLTVHRDEQTRCSTCGGKGTVWLDDGNLGLKPTSCATCRPVIDYAEIDRYVSRLPQLR